MKLPEFPPQQVAGQWQLLFDPYHISIKQTVQPAKTKPPTTKMDATLSNTMGGSQAKKPFHQLTNRGVMVPVICYCQTTKKGHQ